MRRSNLEVVVEALAEIVETAALSHMFCICVSIQMAPVTPFPVVRTLAKYAGGKESGSRE